VKDTDLCCKINAAKKKKKKPTSGSEDQSVKSGAKETCSRRADMLRHYLFFSIKNKYPIEKNKNLLSSSN